MAGMTGAISALTGTPASARARIAPSRAAAAGTRGSMMRFSKDVNAVVDAADKAGLARKVAGLKPVICVKG